MSSPPIAFRPGQPNPSQGTGSQGQYVSNMMAFSAGGMGNQGGGYTPPPAFSGGLGFGAMNPGGFPGSNFQQPNLGRVDSSSHRQTFYGKSGVGNASQNMQKAHIDHLKNLMPFVEKELKASNCKYTIKNNSENQQGSKDFELTLNGDVDLRIGDNIFPVRFKIPKEFPNHPPTAISKIPITHPIIDKNNLEIKFSDYYKWDKKTSKLIELINATTKYFTENSPFKNNEGTQLEVYLRKFEDQAIKKFENMDMRQFYSTLK